MCFRSYKGVEGVAVMTSPRFLSINSMILLCFMLLKGGDLNIQKRIRSENRC